MLKIRKSDLDRGLKKINVELTCDLFGDVIKIADAYGLPATTMIRSWIIRRIREEKTRWSDKGRVDGFVQESLFTKPERKKK